MVDKDEAAALAGPGEQFDAAAKRAEARFLIRRAGQMDQAARAKEGTPPRRALRALDKASTGHGRKKAKARARIKREAIRRFGMLEVEG